jgi:hypothetical protein
MGKENYLSLSLILPKKLRRFSFFLLELAGVDVDVGVLEDDSGESGL